MVKLEGSQKEMNTVTAIVTRATTMLNLELHWDSSRISLSMDLLACHLNGCPLDLDGLLDASKLDFVHDVTGIMRHIDRKTGKLQHCFCPRYAATWEQRVQLLEAEGLTRSDAQAVVDAEDAKES